MISYWWVSTPTGTFAITAHDGKVIDCAPWAKRSAMGRPIDDVLQSIANSVTLWWSRWRPLKVRL